MPVPGRRRTWRATALAMFTATCAVFGADWSATGTQFPFGPFEVRPHAFGLTVAARGSLVGVRVQPCYETLGLASAPQETVSVCEPGDWPSRATPSRLSAIWTTLDGAAGRPRAAWKAATGRPFELVARPDGNAIRFDKVVGGLAADVVHYAHAFALNEAHVVHDGDGVAYTHLDDATLLDRLGLHPDTDPDPWRGLPEETPYLALHDTLSGTTLYLLRQPGSRLRVDRRRNMVLRQQRLEPALGRPLEIAIRLHAVLPPGLAP
ncbi:MAG: hypothetical protein NDJ94_00025 [Vicinamibacteria bacterium]|nr:hypothetical protein [Vicinamibacteria bacterium]